MATKKQRIVIVGAGFAGVYVYKHLHSIFHNDNSVRISVINERNYFLFTPLLHEVATGGQARENIMEPLHKELCCIARLHLTRATNIDPESRVVETLAGDVPYDYLVLAPGSSTNFFNTPGAADHCYTLKTLDDAVNIKNQVIRCIERANSQGECDERKTRLTFVVVGGGATGVELSAELSELACGTLAPLYRVTDAETRPNIVLVHAEKDLITQFPEKLRKEALKILRKKGIDVRLGATVAAVANDSVTLGSGETIGTKTVVWTAGVKPNTIPFTKNVEQAKNGAYMVNEYLQLPQYPNIFALGDAAAFTNPGEERPVPTHAQTAVAEAGRVAENIARLIKKRPLRAFQYHHKGDLISLGRWRAGASIAGITFSGRFAWWLWRTVYLFKLLSWQKKVRVAMDWTLNIFSKRDISEL